MYYIILLVLLALLFYFIYFIIHVANGRNFKESKEQNKLVYKVPSTFPILGSIEYFNGPFNFLKANSKDHPEIFYFKLLGNDIYYIGNTDEARNTFFKNKNLDFYGGYMTLFGAIIGQQFFADHNKAISMLLKPESIKKYIADVIDFTPKYMNQLWDEKTKVDLFHTTYNMIFKMTTRIIGSPEVSGKYFNIISYCYHILDSEFSTVSLFAPKVPTYTKIKRWMARQIISYYLGKLIDERIKNPEKFDDNIKNSIKFYTENEVLDKDQTIYLLLGAFFGAQTNTALSGAWTLLYLISHPEYMKIASDEINNTINKYGKLTYEALLEMKFVEKCIIEALRLTISSGGWWRKVTKDFYYKDYKIPQGAIMVTNPALYHNDKNYFEAPDIFNPYRDNSKAIPFGTGDHPCLGKRLAILENQVFVATALTNYKIMTPDENIPAVNRNTMHGSWPQVLPFIQVEKVEKKE